MDLHFPLRQSWYRPIGVLLLGLTLGRPCAALGCDTPVIVSAGSNSPLCPGDSVDLVVYATGDILGYSWQGPETATQFTTAPLYTFPFFAVGEFTIIVYGDCGTDTAVVQVSAQGAGAGQGDTLHVCDDSAPLDLALALGAHAEGGEWTIGGADHSAWYDPATDSSGEYIYTVIGPITCPGVAASAIVTVLESNAGRDTALALCGSDAPFNLDQALSAGTDSGGSWSQVVFFALFPHGPVYDPAIDSSAFFQYAISVCTATVQVTEVAPAPWFSDADQDGWGDPATLLWACTPPQGWVADSTDSCPLLPGRVGDPCDDGLSATVGDTITDSCTCTGQLPTLIQDENTAGTERWYWPDPAAGDILFVQAYGAAFVDLFNVLGNRVLQYRSRAANGKMQVPLDGLAPGMYLIRIKQGEVIKSGRLVLQ